jgi:glycosyltransferase involved in cell wall biosynthesis
MTDRTQRALRAPLDAERAVAPKKILIISDSVGSPRLRRGIFHCTTQLIRALHLCGHHVTLLVEAPPLGRASISAMGRLAGIAKPAWTAARLGSIYNYLSRGANPQTLLASTRSLLGQYLGGVISRHGGLRAEILRHDLRHVDYLAAGLDHLRPVDDFLVMPAVYSGAILRALLGLRPAIVDARGFDTVIIDTPTYLRIESSPGCEIVAVIHDLIMLSEASVNQRWRRIFTNKLLATIGSANDFLFVSAATKAAFQGLFPGVARNKAEVLHPCPYAELPAVACGDSDHGSFVAIVNDEPRKNLDTLLQAFALLGEGQRLHIIGPSAGHRQLAPALAHRVTFHGYLSEQKKQELLGRCSGIIVPSLAEGFGIPIVEGGMLGKPVFCSDLAVFREIAGDGAFYFDQTRPESIASVLTAYCHDPAAYAGRVAETSKRLRERFSFNTLVHNVAQRFGKA